MDPAGLTLVIEGHDIVVDRALICSSSALIKGAAVDQHHRLSLSLPEIRLPSIYQPACGPLQAFLLYLRIVTHGGDLLHAYTDAETAAVAAIATYLISPEIVTLCDRRFTSHPYTVLYGQSEILEFARAHQLKDLYSSVLMTKLIDESDHLDIESVYRISLREISAALSRFAPHSYQCYSLSLFFKLVKIAAQLTLISDEIRARVQQEHPDFVIVFGDAVRAQAMAEWCTILVPYWRNLCDLKLAWLTTRYFRSPDPAPLLQISELMNVTTFRLLEGVQDQSKRNIGESEAILDRNTKN